ncbi:hypothetical protein KCU65_g3429, partial [Aureobasidium melanogenum]
MAIQDNTILGLRTQILVIAIGRKDSLYEAVFTELYGYVYKVSGRHPHVEEALRDLLDWTSDMVGQKLDYKRDCNGNIVV